MPTIPKQYKKQRRKCFTYYFGLLLIGCVECTPRQIVLPGDIILGGLFPIHEAGRNASNHCGRIKADQGVQRMGIYLLYNLLYYGLVAMMFALDAINMNPKILPNIRLGAQILDTW